jgi:CHAT domain-containing protein/tetratricopeptide (TPR) repeat protein
LFPQDALRPDEDVVGRLAVGESRTYRVAVEAEGPHRIDLHSHFFDTYLVLCDGAGSVVAEEDHGPLGRHAQVVFDARAGDEWTVVARASDGASDSGAGEFTLTLAAGVEELTGEPLRAARRADLEQRVELVELARGPESLDFALALGDLAVLLHDDEGELRLARTHLERALEVCEAAVGPEHVATTRIVGELGTLLQAQGEYAFAREMHERALAIREAVLGPDHPDTAISLNNLGDLLRVLGENERAMALFERALAIHEAAYGPEHEEVATVLNNLAVTYMQMGDYDAARPLLERDLAISEKVLGPRHPDTATSLNNLAGLCWFVNDLQDARAYWERALAIFAEALGEEHPRTADTRLNLGTVLRSLGDDQAGREIAERSLAASELALGTEHPNVARALTVVALTQMQLGEYSASRENYERALAIYESSFGPDHVQTARALRGLANLYMRAGDLELAEQHSRRSVEVFERTLGRGNPGIAESLSLHAEVLNARGKIRASRTASDRALAIRELIFGPDHELTAASLNQVASFLYQQRDLEPALELTRRALAIYERKLSAGHPRLGTAYNDLALVLAYRGELVEARELLEKAVEIGRRTVGADNPKTVTSMSNLATIRRLQGDFEAAGELYDRVRTSWTAHLGPDHPALAENDHQAGFLAHEQGDLERAIELYDNSIRVRTLHYGGSDPRSEGTLGDMVLALIDAGQLEAAGRRLGANARERRRTKLAWLGSLSQAELFSYLGLSVQLVEIELSLGAVRGTDDARCVAYGSVLGLKGQIARIQHASRAHQAAEMTEGERASFDALRDCQARLAERSRATHIADLQGHEAELAELRHERNRLEVDLRRASGAESRDPTFEELRDVLPERSVVIDFLAHRVYRPTETGQVRGTWSELRLSAWVTRPGAEAPAHFDLGPAEEVERAVRGHLFAIVGLPAVAMRGRGLGVEEFERGSVASLEELLLAPMAPLLEGVDTVFVSPDTFLGALPLETLRLDEETFALERFAFVYQHDLSPERFAERADEPNLSTLLAVGGVAFDEWPDLPGTEAEARAVVGVHSGPFAEGVRTSLAGKDADKAALARALEGHTVLHLGTHGYFNPDGLRTGFDGASEDQIAGLTQAADAVAGRHPGLLSGLVCAGDDLLTASEVEWLDLAGAELVVLSACETGLGRAKAGEGLIGLRRSFHTAGARTVISSLWSIQDESSAELMSDFYRNLWERGLGRVAALRRAQLDLLSQNRAEHGDPRPATWGAFVLSGEWR